MLQIAFRIFKEIRNNNKYKVKHGKLIIRANLIKLHLLQNSVNLIVLQDNLILVTRLTIIIINKMIGKELVVLVIFQHN